MDGARRTVTRDLLIVGLVAFVVRLVWVLIVRSAPVSDFLFYHLRAIDLARGLGYSWYGHPTAFWPPGYPLFLSVLYRIAGPSVGLARLANVFLWTGTALIAYLLGVRVGGQRTGLVAGLLVAVFPDFIFYSSILASENLFVLLLSGSLLLVVLVVMAPPGGKRDVLAIAAAGLLFGFAALTRAFVIAVPVLLVPVMLVAMRSRRLGQRLVLSGALLGCMVLVLVPWVARNWIVMGQPVIATEGGVTLWIGNHPDASGEYDLRGMPRIASLATVQGEMAKNSGYTRLALSFIVNHPIEWLSYAPRKLWYLFGEQPVIFKAFFRDADGQPGGRLVLRHLSAAETWIRSRAHPIASATRMIQAVYWFLGVAGLVLAMVRKRIAAVILFIPVAYLLVFSATLGHGEPRYLISVAPLLAPGIGYLVWAATVRRPAEGDQGSEGTAATV